ncbi:MAG: flagellar motor switch protein FliN [Candidatus Aminicenantes bacterium]|nr:flagellar motor switch protein FliN [Candidatus Aminicenantes bacterium]NIM83566.1 flagellar motor switch protein FliN [Candidatus Aminicenantes bacterium]NIN22966.1 flagellar motor switch protein FliN [Candidatus Aminicenantes bacterium]NIN46703.1 flagellar motor switch protein FliN [Candidatus Aminicenantes bacterium]NIN89609.1 flagellar motor switch protein FliN [Candidatus Aminicenantes bacterium]
MNDQTQLINIFVENWTSVYNTILGRDVRITIDSVEMKSKNEVKAAFGDFQSFVRLSYKEKKNRNLVIALRNKLVSIIANMMIGLDTFKDEISADDKDAFEEAVNQMFSACQVPLKETLGLDMKFKDISFVKPVDAAALIGGGKSKTWNCTIELQDVAEEQFILVTPRKFGEVGEKKVKEIAVEAPTEAPYAHVPTAAAPSPIRGEFAYEGTNIDMLLDVELPITVRIGSTEMRLIDIMKLGLGSIIELERLVDDPVEVLVNDKLVAKGEVVVCDSKFAVRVTEVQSRAERIKSLA